MRNVFGSLAGLAFVGCGLTAMIHTIIAGRHMSAQVKDPIGEMNWRGALFFGGRDMFTEKGWRHRNLALRFLGFALLAFCAIVVLN